MKTADFDYVLPQELIAQIPSAVRDQSRLLTLDRHTGTVGHKVFSSMPELVREGDRLIFNNTKVLKARVFGRLESGGKVEFLFTDNLGDGQWRAMAKPGRKLKVGRRVFFGEKGECSVEICQVYPDGARAVCVASNSACENIYQLIDQYGVIPLPPYIERGVEADDLDRYQTVYAEKMGAVAAPTAGLHFTQDLMKKLGEKGIDTSYVTLHVGPGTFVPVKELDPRKHPMHWERYELDSEVIRGIQETRARGGRVIAVGTTVVRVLEHCAKSGTLKAGVGSTNLLILPPYRFRVVDALITNFHLPKSTLLMLVSAFAGRENVLNAYSDAVKHGYRFYSYGDAMFIC